MKKLLSIIVSLLFLTSILGVSAAPPVPMPFAIYVNFEGSPVNGLDVTFTCDGNSVTKTTNSLGGVMVDIGTGSPDFDSCLSILTVTCEEGLCSEQYNVNAIETPYQDNIDTSDEPPSEEEEPEGTVNSNEDDSIAMVELFLGEEIDILVTDNKLSKLLDEEIDFDGEDYNIHEEIRLKGKIVTSIDNEDYGEDPYLVIAEGGIEYRYVFDDAIPNADIDEDEPLEIVLLGESVEIVEKSADSITLISGEEVDVKEGESANGVSVEVINEDYVLVVYNGESEKIYEGEVEEVNGIEVYVVEVVVNEDGDDICTLRIAEDVKETIQTGDDYLEGDDWEWIVTADYIGLTNQNEYEDLDEDYLPLKEGDKIVFPNDFATIKFSDLTKPVMNDLTLKVKDDAIRVRSADDTFNDEFDTVFVKAGGIYDEDDVLISTDSVRIGESDIRLEKGSVIIGNLKVTDGMLDILYNGVSYANMDDVYLDYEGVIFKDPEEAIVDKDGFDVSVPDEKPEVTITIGAEPEDSRPIECPACPTTDPTDCPAVTCPTCPAVTCPDPIVCDECPEPEDCPGGLSAAIAALITFLVGGGGAYFLKKGELAVKGTGVKIYTNRNGDRVRLHRHPGTKGYHDPFTPHRVVKERHPKGQLDPEYEKDDSGEWAYVG